MNVLHDASWLRRSGSLFKKSPSDAVFFLGNKKPLQADIHGELSLQRLIRRSSNCSLLPSRLYCRFWNSPLRHQISRLRGSRTIPPVGNLTLPRRILFFFVLIILYMYSGFNSESVFHSSLEFTFVSEYNENNYRMFSISISEN